MTCKTFFHGHCFDGVRKYFCFVLLLLIAVIVIIAIVPGKDTDPTDEECRLLEEQGIVGAY
jgi:hypothetical protein